MPIAAHFVNQPHPETRRRYETGIQRLDELGARHPDGRLSHTSWIVGSELHVLDVWESQDKLDAFFGTTLGPILGDLGMDLAGPPQIGDLVKLVLPPVV